MLDIVMDAILELLIASPALSNHLKTLGDLLARGQEIASVTVLGFQLPAWALFDCGENFRALSVLVA